MPDLHAHLMFSYAHADEGRLSPFVERFSLKLEHTLWIDKQGIERGVAWEKAIRRAIDTSYGVIFALTQAAIASEYILTKEIPWAYERFKDIQGASLFVLLLDDVPVPRRLRTPNITYLIDARDGDFERVSAELAKPGVLPKPRVSGHTFLVDWPRLANFQGRDDALLTVHKMLMGAGGQLGVKILSTYGMSGIGKTQLAVEYAHRYRFYYPAGVYWLNAAQDWTRELAACAEYLGLKPLDESAPLDQRPGQLALAFKNYLHAQDGDALIILDNAADPNEINSRQVAPKLTMRGLSDSTRAKLLLTTRLHSAPDGMASVEIGVLAPADARVVLLDGWVTQARTDAPDNAALDALAKTVGWLPLALGWLAAALSKRPTLTAQKLLDLLRERGIDSLVETLKKQNIRLGTPDHYAALVGVALDWQLEQLKMPEALTLLKLIAAYGEAAVVPISRLRLLSGIPVDDFDDPFAAALDELRAYSLTETLADGLRLHPLTGGHLRVKYDASTALTEGAGKLTAAYCDPDILAEAFTARGFPAVLNDVLVTGISLKRNLTPQPPRPNKFGLERGSSSTPLAELEWLLLRLEPLVINLPIGVGKAAIPISLVLIQQVRAHAHDEGDDALRAACDRWLAKRDGFAVGLGERYPADRVLLRILIGHTSAVRGALVLADGRILSWGGKHTDDKSPRLWGRDGDPLAVLKGHTSWIIGALALTDGRILSWSEDKTLRLWSDEGKPLAALEGHTGGVTGALALADGRILSWSDDKTLRLWSSGGKPLAVLEGHQKSVTGALALADGRFLTWSWDKTPRLWSGAGEPLAVLEGHQKSVTGALALTDGRFLTWSEDGTLRLWNGTGKALVAFAGYSSWVKGALELTDGRILSWSEDKTLWLWSHEGTALAALEGHTKRVTGALALTDGRILSWSEDGTLRLWNGAGKPLGALHGHDRVLLGHVYGALVLADGRILSWSEDGTLRLWNHAGKPLGVLTGHGYGVNGALALADGRILSWSRDKTLRLWSDMGNPLAALKERKGRVIDKLVDGRILLWSLYGSLRLWWRKGHGGNDGHALLLADGRRLSWNWSGLFWLESSKGRWLKTLEGHYGIVSGAVELADGRLLSWASDAMLRLWSIDGKPLAVLKGHTDGVSGALALADGRLLSWGSEHTDDKTLRLWSDKGNPLAVYVHRDSIETVVALGGNRFAFGDTRGRVVFFDVTG